MGIEPENFSPEIYAEIRAGAQRSAAAAVPVILAAVGAATVWPTAVDVGCGEGWWGRAVAEHGFTVQGLDTGRHDAAIDIIDCNLEQPLPDIGRFGLALCLEVAEHLSPARAESFTRELCGLADLIVFSAAIPGQGGTGHVNEQWPGYWVERFQASGYTCSGALRWRLWDDERVENWYRQNLLIAARHPGMLPGLFDTPLAPVWPVVHPILFDARRP